MADIFNMLDLWDNAGTTYTSIKMNATNTASASGTLLMDLQVGGTSQFSVSKAGVVTLLGNAIAASSANILANSYRTGSGVAEVAIGYYGSGVWMGSNSQLGWGSSGASALDTILVRDAANTLAQRNGTNAQAFRLYNTYTDASNYERGKFTWSSNVLQIGTEKAGTGTARALELQTDGTTRLTISTTGVVVAANYIESAAAFGFFLTGRSGLSSSADGVLRVSNNGISDFNRLQLGGGTAAYPAIARDGAGTKFVGGDGTSVSHIKVPGVTVANLPAAATAGAGARSFVTDALTPVFGSAVAGSGAVNVPVYSDGSAWNVG